MALMQIHVSPIRVLHAPACERVDILYVRLLAHCRTGRVLRQGNVLRAFSAQ